MALSSRGSRSGAKPASIGVIGNQPFVCTGDDLGCCVIGGSYAQHYLATAHHLFICSVRDSPLRSLFHPRMRKPRFRGRVNSRTMQISRILQQVVVSLIRPLSGALTIVSEISRTYLWGYSIFRHYHHRISPFRLTVAFADLGDMI
jgi:hypothetical protein